MGNGVGAVMSAVLQMPLLAGPGGSFQATSIYMCGSKYTINNYLCNAGHLWGKPERMSGVAEATLQWSILHSIANSAIYALAKHLHHVYQPTCIFNFKTTVFSYKRIYNEVLFGVQNISNMVKCNIRRYIHVLGMHASETP